MTRSKVAAGGRVVIPAEYRRQLGIEIGDDVVFELQDNQIRVMTIDQAVRQAQAIVRQYIPVGRSLSDELIAERRTEAARE